MVGLLASAMFKRECGQHARIGMRVIIAILFVDVAKAMLMTHVPTLLLVLLENVRLTIMELQGKEEPEEQMGLLVPQDTLGWMRKQQRQEKKERQDKMQLHTSCKHSQEALFEKITCYLMFPICTKHWTK